MKRRRPVGFSEQKTEVASIITSAFGWRTLARELIGKIPMGGGLVPKAAVSYAGTYVVGESLERYYRLGYGFSKAEKESAYAEALAKGKLIATRMLDAYRSKQAPQS